MKEDIRYSYAITDTEEGIQLNRFRFRTDRDVFVRDTNLGHFDGVSFTVGSGILYLTGWYYEFDPWSDVVEFEMERGVDDES